MTDDGEKPLRAKFPSRWTTQAGEQVHDFSRHFESRLAYGPPALIWYVDPGLTWFKGGKATVPVKLQLCWLWLRRHILRTL